MAPCLSYASWVSLERGPLRVGPNSSFHTEGSFWVSHGVIDFSNVVLWGPKKADLGVVVRTPSLSSKGSAQERPPSSSRTLISFWGVTSSTKEFLHEYFTDSMAFGVYARNMGRLLHEALRIF